MEGWRLNGLPTDQAQYWHQRAVGSTDAAIKALGDARVDPLVRQGIVDRVTLLEPDYRARYATALAQMAELTPHAEGPNALKAYQALLVNARQRQSIVVGQLNQLARENGGELPMKGDAAPTVAMLWQELNGAPHAGTQGITHELNHYAQQIRKLQTGGVGGTG
jgi:hypothetical protein